MTFEGMGEMFEGDSADTCEKFPLVSMGGRAEGLACADPGARTPIGTSGNFSLLKFLLKHKNRKKTVRNFFEIFLRLSDTYLFTFTPEIGQLSYPILQIFLFSVIVKVETFNEDRMGIHKLVGLPYKDTGHYHDLTKILNTTKSTEDWTKSLFENVSMEVKQQLQDIYKYDFEMFEYDPFLY
jgi:hypothetical protein